MFRQCSDDMIVTLLSMTVLWSGKQFLFVCLQGNALYNILPDAISRLSDLDIGVEEEHFQVIMK